MAILVVEILFHKIIVDVKTNKDVWANRSYYFVSVSKEQPKEFPYFFTYTNQNINTISRVCTENSLSCFSGKKIE